MQKLKKSRSYHWCTEITPVIAQRLRMSIKEISRRLSKEPSVKVIDVNSGFFDLIGSTTQTDRDYCSADS